MLKININNAMCKIKNVKEWVTVVTCILSFICGFGLCIAGFCVPPVGVVSGSVLWILGQSLLYTGAVLGISNHYDTKLKNFEVQINNKLDEVKSN